MIHHTILDPMAIFGGEFEYPEIIECRYLGQQIEAFKLSDSTVVISRVISTDPYVYLNPQLQPGCKLELSITEK